MEALRFQVVGEAFKKKPLDVIAPTDRPAKYFGSKVFNREKMYKYLPKDVYEKMIDVMDNGARLDREVADAVAAGMKQWATENGVTHYTHWFQPLTEGTAEKHDSFIEHDGKGGMVEEFTGKLLVQQEPDASSFPSGGIRSTFEARGYSAWDPTSPVFIIDDTLCIPTVFISYTGEALDYKAPLLRALHAVNVAATEVCHYFDPTVKKVTSNLGWEQEYFLVDEGLYSARPDLLLTGRTLMGHDSAKNQQMDDHYFGSIPERVAAFMRELEIVALELGIPCKTRHNEVAPNQFELAPIFEETNLAVDHNMLLMSVMKRVARKHGFRVLLHEKPFAGINGSGKHNNWSLSTDNGVLLHAAHRLGANEAPPAIISSFLGKQVSELLDHIEVAPPSSPEGDTIDIKSIEAPSGAVGGAKHSWKMDIPEIPELFIDNTDRNRTSPFAFTGNRFEFRAVGSEANCASAMIALNSAVAEALVDFKKRVDQKISEYSERPEFSEGTGHTPKFHAIIDVLREDIKTCKPIRFDGNGYSDEWVEEAARRGLDVEKSCPIIFERYLDDASVQMFESLGVMTRKELEARNEVKWETYTKKIQIEARVLGDLSMNHIIPVATRYQTQLLQNISNMAVVFPIDTADKLSARNKQIIQEIAERTSAIEKGVEDLVEARKKANKIADEHLKAIAYHDTVEPKLDLIRYQADKLELIVDDSLWPLPKYRELLFIR